VPENDPAANPAPSSVKSAGRLVTQRPLTQE
jgi:hypothetical protein